ncbi:MAG: FG-GAP repeat domain-containing protein [Candidatus Hydrogenedens sp.]
MILRLVVACILLFFIGIGLFVFFEDSFLSIFNKEEPVNPQILLGHPSSLDETGLPRYELFFLTLKKEPFQFEPVSIPIHRYQLFDFGVADINQDGLLDIFSSNCNFRPSILLNRGEVTFENAILELNLGLQPDIPDFACSIAPHKIVERGLYIFYLWHKVHIYYIELSRDTVPLQIEVIVPHTRTETIETKGNVSISKIQTQEDEKSAGLTQYKLNMEHEALVVIDIDRPAISTQFTVSNTFPLNKIYIGPAKISPSGHTFTLNTFDRHSYSWADINADGKIDVFSGRGGLRGSPEYDHLRKKMKDQLFLNVHGNRFENVYDTSGLENCSCGTRKSCWVNIDNDDNLELFILCARNEFCRLFRKEDKENIYKECAMDYGLDIQGDQPIFWFDMNNDGYADLISFYNKKLTIFINQQGKQFQKQFVEGTENIELLPSFLAPCDFNNDGSMEFLFANQPDHKIFVFRHRGNTTFEWLNPEDFQLPPISIWVCWADLNNDGYDELISIPEGIFLNHQGRTFEKMDLLTLTHIPLTEMSDARVQSFDVDNDGKQDVMLGYRIKGDNPSGYGDWWYLSFLKNTSNIGNWITLELQGPKGNPHAFTTQVLCKTKGKVSKLRIIGEAEHSRANQGNYRIHLGLDSQQEVPPLFILTSEGEIQIRNLIINTLNKIKLNLY